MEYPIVKPNLFERIIQQESLSKHSKEESSFRSSSMVRLASSLTALPVELQRHIVFQLESVLPLLTVNRTLNALGSERLYRRITLSDLKAATFFVDLILRSAWTSDSPSPPSTTHPYGTFVRYLTIIIGALDDRSSGPGALHDLINRSQPGLAQALPRLQWLRIAQFLSWPTTISGSVVVPFATHCSSLSLLSMVNTQMSSSSWDTLAGNCRGLRELNIKEICVVLEERVTASALQQFAKNCGRTLEKLRLGPVDVPGEEGLVRFVSACPNLRWVELSGSSPHRELTLVSCRVVRELAERCPFLEMLMVRHCDELDDEALSALGDLKRLKHIELFFRPSMDLGKEYRRRYFVALTRRNKALKVTFDGVVM